MDLTSIIAELKAERARIDSAIHALEGTQTRTRRTLSADARARIGAAMKKRWAQRKQNGVGRRGPIPVRKTA